MSFTSQQSSVIWDYEQKPGDIDVAGAGRARERRAAHGDRAGLGCAVRNPTQSCQV